MKQLKCDVCVIKERGCEHVNSMLTSMNEEGPLKWIGSSKELRGKFLNRTVKLKN